MKKTKGLSPSWGEEDKYKTISSKILCCHNIGLFWLKYPKTNVDSTKRYQEVEASKYGYIK